MENEIISLNNNWESFALSDNQKHFCDIINIVKQLDDGNISTDLWTKWKNYANQIVIETPNYFFKIYNDSSFSAEYLAHIREKLGEIYRNEYNLLWDVKTIYYDNKLYQIERREKLQVCNPNMMSIEDLFLNYNNVLKKLEKKLLLPQITKQIKNKVKNISQIKLIRECIPKYEDYAIKNGNIILLDDADWFLSFVDEEGNVLTIPNTYFEVISSFDYDSLLCSCDWGELMTSNIELGNIKRRTTKWIITKKSDEVLTLYKDLEDEYTTTIRDTIKILSTDKKIKNKCLYYDKSDTNLLSNNISNDIFLLDNKKEV